MFLNHVNNSDARVLFVGALRVEMICHCVPYPELLLIAVISVDLLTSVLLGYKL